MVMNISSALSAYKQADASNLLGKGAASATDIGAKGDSFSNVLTDFLGDTVKSARESEQLAAKGAMGKADLQEVILAVSNTEVMMQTLTTIRDKVITAYQEVLRTSI